MAPFLKDAATQLLRWEDISMLSVAVDHLIKGYGQGVLCIGDAAHAMSPVGGVGINLAIQDAVATANLLYPALHLHLKPGISLLKKVQKRRAFPARAIHRLQIAVHKGILEKQLYSVNNIHPPIILLLLKKIPSLRRIPAWLIGMGIRREHTKTPVQN